MEAQDIAAAFTALGQPTRLDILRSLIAAGPGGVAAGELATALAIPASTLSFHLRGLEQAGLVAATRHGRTLAYAPQPDRLQALHGFLAEACARLGPAGAAPQPFTVLFLCSRNSARSIMAEAILSRLAPGRFVALSAGSVPAPDGPLPEVLAQLRALGHDISGLRSKSWNEFAGTRADFVITLCDIAVGQVCPEFAGVRATAAWPLPDPASFSGGAAERASLLNELYAALRRRLEAFTALPLATLDGIALKARIDELADPHRKGG
jgi:protein-tyrosine-phosphatase/DNA-binding transcriptional ArsR family regulator